MKKTNFDEYLEAQLEDPAFAARYEAAGKAWDVALQITALRQEAGLSQKELAQIVGTSQQQISRLESAGYEGHSVSTLRRVAGALNATLRITFESLDAAQPAQVAESPTEYGGKAEGKGTRGKRGGAGETGPKNRKG